MSRLNKSRRGGVFSSFVIHWYAQSMRVLQNEFSWCPCGFPPVQRGTWQVSREQLLIVRAVAVLWRVCLIFRASAYLFPQCFVSVKESLSYSSLDLLIKTQVLDEAKQTAVSSCSGVCIRRCLTGRISGEEFYALISIFATKHLQLT